MVDSISNNIMVVASYGKLTPDEKREIPNESFIKADKLLNAKV